MIRSMAIISCMALFSGCAVSNFKILDKKAIDKPFSKILIIGRKGKAFTRRVSVGVAHVARELSEGGYISK